MSAELEVVEQQPTLGISLVSGPDPELAIAYARRAAKALQGVLEEGSGYVTIQGRKHITLEGWQTLAAATNHSIEVEWSRPMESPEGAWEARAVVRDGGGQIVAAGESMADPAEKGGRWASGGTFAIRSMAQTRAMVRAASARLRFIPSLAGFSGTPAEEMPRESPTPAKPKPQTPYEELLAIGRTEGMSKTTVRATLKAAGIERPKDLEDPAVFKVAMDAVLGVVGPDDKGGLPVADPMSDRMMGETDTKGVPWVDTLDAEREAKKKKDEPVQGELVDDDEKAADAAWQDSKP